jgi:hypothetical protein
MSYVNINTATSAPASQEMLKQIHAAFGATPIMAHVALNLFTDYVNVAFNVPVDFPKVALKAA